MMESDIDRLLNLLIAEGWNEEVERVVSPNETMWLRKEQPWVGSGSEFLSLMQGRLDRILFRQEALGREYSKSSMNSVNDTKSLIACLREVFAHT